MPEIPKSLEDFITNEKYISTKNPLFNLAVANMRVSRALQRAVNNQSKAVSTIADQINSISELNSTVQSYTQNKTNADEPISFGKTKAEAKVLLDRLKAAGVDMKILDPMYAEYADTSKTSVQITDNKISLISSALNAKIENLNTQTSKENLSLQTLTNRYTQSGDQASTVLQKDSQSKSTIISGIKGLS
ncbi:MAG: hypothetical protein LW714_03655 [Oxalobacteraceae bacterium]|jgi:hypothetical protein|nr:hypothetical protein [Oxalobacteraceae bacterium]